MGGVPLVLAWVSSCALPPAFSLFQEPRARDGAGGAGQGHAHVPAGMTKHELADLRGIKQTAAAAGGDPSSLTCLACQQ